MTTAERNALIAELIGDEKLRLKPYEDTRGVLTIGVGRNLRDKGLSKGEALTLCDNDVAECLMDLRTFDWFGSLSPIRQRAIVNFRFNVGAGTFRMFVQLLAAMAARDYVAAGDALVDSQWYHQVQRARSTRIVRQIRDGL